MTKDISNVFHYQPLVNYWPDQVLFLSFDGTKIHAIYKSKKMNDIHLYRKLWHVYLAIQKIYECEVILYYQPYPAFLSHDKRFQVFKI